jgi:HAD superfamily hydrolase (TIGR01549 family)
MKKQKIIIYDFDGVICDSVDVKTDAFVELYCLYNSDIVEKIKNYHLLNGGISRYEKIKYFQNNILNKPVSQEEINRIADIFSQLVKEKVINSPYINGAYEFINKHAKDTKQFICTGTPSDEISEIVQKKGIDLLFDGVYGSPESKVSIINKILLGEDNYECVFFGDAMTDYNAAKECQLKFVGIKNNKTQFPPETILIDDFYDNYLNCLF